MAAVASAGQRAIAAPTDRRDVAIQLALLARSSRPDGCWKKGSKKRTPVNEQQRRRDQVARFVIAAVSNDIDFCVSRRALALWPPMCTKAPPTAGQWPHQMSGFCCVPGPNKTMIGPQTQRTRHSQCRRAGGQRAAHHIARRHSLGNIIHLARWLSQSVALAMVHELSLARAARAAHRPKPSSKPSAGSHTSAGSRTSATPSSSSRHKTLTTRHPRHINSTGAA